jgi:hypothetical protein
MKILLIHGVGYQEDAQFQNTWKPLIEARLPGKTLAFASFDYDQLFKDRRIDWWHLGSTAKQLLMSWLEHGRDDEAVQRGLFTPAEATFGMAIKWAQFEDLRRILRNRLAQKIATEQPDVVVSHSLGTLIAYDLLARPQNQANLANIAWLTMGSQIAHPALRNLFDGYLTVPPVRHWYAQYNRHDRVFAWEPVDLSAPNFSRVDSPFHEAIINHDAACYLKAAETDFVWRAIAERSAAPIESVRVLAGAMRQAKSVAAVTRARSTRATYQPNRRALLIGINDYAIPQLKLDGCVNDAYLMSAVLQEQGFAAEDIRMVVNERANSEGIKSRIGWLLADTRPGDVRVLYFSGHGVQMPAYGTSGGPDHLVEALVPHDFDWSEENSIGDKWLCRQYGNLPYGAHMVAVFDCCHSGGMTRGAALKVRSIAPPDDIAHRQIKWDADWKMWVPRDFVKPSVKRLASYDPRTPVAHLCRGSALRPARPPRDSRTFGHHGPYMPAILMACKVDERAHEYRHGGGHSYGAFTYALSQVLRDKHRRPVNTLQDLCDQVNDRLPALGYDQHCAIEGPTPQLDAVGAWVGAV